MHVEENIMSVRDCLKEVKRVAGDLLSDEEMNDVLTKIELNIKQKKNLRKVELNDDKIAAFEATRLEREQALKKRTLAEDTIKAVQEAKHIIDTFGDNYRGGIKALLVGIQDYRTGSRRSVTQEQTASEERFTTNLVNDLKRAKVLDEAVDGKMDLEIKKELVERGSSGVPQAKKIADILERYSEEIRTTLNDLGADIPKLKDWISRQFHDSDRLERAGAVLNKTMTKNRAVHKAAWVDYIYPLLDKKRTFFGDANEKEILGEIWENLSTGYFNKSEGIDTISGNRSLTDKVSQNRVLHFKDAEARHQYDVTFGSPRLLDSFVVGMNSNARNIATIARLGSRPKATFEKILRIVGNHHKDKSLTFDNFKAEFSELDGSAYQLDGNGTGSMIAAKVGMYVRFGQTTGKLGFATVSSFADVANYALAARYQGRGLFTGLAEGLAALKKNKEALEVLNITSNSVLGTINQKFGARGDASGTAARLQSAFFKLNSLNWWVSSLKTGMQVGLARQYGMKSKLSFKDLNVAERRLLGLYGIDSGKWDLLRSMKTIEADGKTYLSAEGLDGISDATVVKYLSRQASDREIRNFKRDLRLSWRNLLQDQAAHGVPEPDGNVRAFMHQGNKRGSFLGETLRFVGQFKQFPISIYKKVILRELKGYAPGEFGASIGGKALSLGSLIILTSMFGYLAMTTKDLLKGKGFRDMEKKENFMAAFLQGGGLGIFGDFLFAEARSQYGGGLASTILGPAVSDAEALMRAIGSLDEPNKAGVKLLKVIEGNTPFLNLYYTKTAYDYLIGYQIKEFLDPGYFSRMRRRSERNQGSEFFFNIK